MKRSLVGIVGIAAIWLGGATSVSAHHAESGGCGTITFISEEGFTATFVNGPSFGPFGEGSWPTSYTYPAPAGPWAIYFFDADGNPDSSADATVEACPAPRPTPQIVVRPKPTPAITPPPTDADMPRPAYYRPALTWWDLGLGFLVVIGITGVAEWVDRKRKAGQWR